MRARPAPLPCVGGDDAGGVARAAVAVLSMFIVSVMLLGVPPVGFGMKALPPGLTVNGIFDLGMHACGLLLAHLRLWWAVCGGAPRLGATSAYVGLLLLAAEGVGAHTVANTVDIAMGHVSPSRGAVPWLVYAFHETLSHTLVYGGHVALLAAAAWEEGRRAGPATGPAGGMASHAAIPPSHVAAAMLHALAAVVVCIGTRTSIPLALGAVAALAAAHAARRDGTLSPARRPLLCLLCLGAPVVLAGVGGWAVYFGGSLPTFDDLRGAYT